MMNIKDNEFKLIGNWVFEENKLVEDETTKRINYLINNSLIKIATDKSGWNVLYQDKDDCRYWELIYTSSELQGGGAPSLINISDEFAKNKYPI